MSFLTLSFPRTTFSLLLLLLLSLIATQLTFSEPLPLQNSPKYFFIIGEQTTGTSYLSELIRLNTSPHDLIDCTLLHSHSHNKLESTGIHHHMMHSKNRRPDSHVIPVELHDPSKPPTFEYNAMITEENLNKMQCPVSETLFILLTKNPFSWIVSMAERFYGTKARRALISTFIAQKWNNNKNLGESNIKNALQLRTAKLQNQMKLQSNKRTTYFITVSYESFIEDAEGSIKDLLDRFRIPIEPVFQGVFYKVLKKPKLLTAGTKNKNKNSNTISETESTPYITGEPFTKYQYFKNEEYLDLFDDKTMDIVTRGLNQNLELKLGYITPPLSYTSLSAKHANTKNKRSRSTKEVIISIWNTIVSLLFWIITPLVIIFAIAFPLIMWLSHSSEAADIIDQGDGLTPEPSVENAKKSNKESALQEGWSEAIDVDTGLSYYFHKISREVIWNRPTIRKYNEQLQQQKGFNKKNDDVNDDDRKDKEKDFNEALYKVAAEKANLQNVSLEDTELLTHEIANKLRRRYNAKSSNSQENIGDGRRDDDGHNDYKSKTQYAIDDTDNNANPMMRSLMEDRRMDDYNDTVPVNEGSYKNVSEGEYSSVNPMMQPDADDAQKVDLSKAFSSHEFMKAQAKLKQTEMESRKLNPYVDDDMYAVQESGGDSGESEA